jgi:16S rRNA processing protein RimM
VAIGRVLKPRGLRGELKVHILCNGPEHFEECIAAGPVRVWRDRSGGTTPSSATPHSIQIASLRFHGGHALVSFTGFDTVEAAEALRGCLIGLSQEDLPPPEEDAYYHQDLEGLAVVDADGALLGAVESVVENPAHDMLLVKPEETESRAFQIPLVEAFVLDIDLAGGRIVVSLPEGLIESQH